MLADQCIWTPASVSNDVESVMLGADWLEDNQCVCSFGSGVLSVNGQPVVILTRKGHICACKHR